MTIKKLLSAAQSEFPGAKLIVQDRRKWGVVPGNPLSGKVLLMADVWGFSARCLGWGDTPEGCLEHAKARKARGEV